MNIRSLLLPKREEESDRRLNQFIGVSNLSVCLLLLVPASQLALAAGTGSAQGNVQVSVKSGSLIIRGDSRDNNIILTENGVAGRAGTTVNGERFVFIPDGVTNDVNIRMKGGDDFVRVELPGTNFAIPHDLVISMDSGADIIELLQVRVPNETRIDTGDGDDVVFIDGVLGSNEFVRSDFAGKFALKGRSGDDLFEFHGAIFRGEVDVRLGSGIDGACSTEDSEFLVPGLANFNGGAPGGFPGDGLVAPSIEFTGIGDFEEFPDDCSFLGGRF